MYDKIHVPFYERLQEAHAVLIAFDDKISGGEAFFKAGFLIRRQGGVL